MLKATPVADCTNKDKGVKIKPPATVGMLFTCRLPALANLLRYAIYKSQDEDDLSLPYSAAATASGGSKVIEHRRHLPPGSGLLNSTEIDAGDTSLLYDASHLGSESELSIDFSYYASTPDIAKLPVA